VPTNHTFYPYIRCLACRAILGGYSDQVHCPAGIPCFRPQDNATRGQMAKIVSNAAGFDEQHNEVVFTDVPANYLFYQYIQRLYARDIVRGYDDAAHCPMGIPCFRPDLPITRGQMAKIDSIAGNILDPIPPNRQTFTDVPPNSTFWLYIERLYARGIVGGYTDPGRCAAGIPCFLPNNQVTRGQTSKIVSNTFFPNCVSPSAQFWPSPISK